VQQAVGEDVATLRVGAQLDLVDGQDLDLAGQRHGLDGADKKGGPRRDNLFLAGDQGDAGLAAQLDDPVIDLPGQQAQRQADHARGMTQHPFDGQVRLAGIGRPEDRGELGRRKACGSVAHDAVKVVRESG